MVKAKNQWKKNFVKARVFLVVFFLGFFLMFNILSSQMLSPIYYQFINEDRRSATIFLQKIKSLPIFDDELKKYKNVFGSSIVNEVFAPDIEKNNEIKKLEQILSKNPQSRDALYGLYLINNSQGNSLSAGKYLKEAMAVDPNIK